MSDFARKQLEKFGWKDGSGLGKDGSGINSYLKVNRRAAGLMSGIGHSAGSGTVNDDMGLGSALKQLGGKTKKDKKRSREDGNASDSSNYFSDSDDEEKKQKEKKKAARQAAASNEKADEVVEKKSSSKKKQVVEESPSSSSSDDSSSDSSEDDTDIMKWDDKKLFAKCGGVRLSSRTGRHRVFNGKLARIEAAKEGKVVPLKKSVEVEEKKSSKKKVDTDSDSD